MTSNTLETITANLSESDTNALIRRGIWEVTVEFRMSAVGDVTILNLEGDFWGKPDEVEMFHDTIERLANGGKVKVVINLAGVNIMNSTGIGMIIAAFRTFREHGGGLVIAEPSESMQSVISIQRWPLGIYKTTEEAVKSFSENQ